MRAALLVCACIVGVTRVAGQTSDDPRIEAIVVDPMKVDDNQQSLVEDVLASAAWGVYVGFAAGVVLAAESMASEPESMGALLVVAVPLVAVPVGAIAGAVVHGLGRDVPGPDVFFD